MDAKKILLVLLIGGIGIGYLYYSGYLQTGFYGGAAGISSYGGGISYGGGVATPQGKTTGPAATPKEQAPAATPKTPTPTGTPSEGGGWGIGTILILIFLLGGGGLLYKFRGKIKSPVGGFIAKIRASSTAPRAPSPPVGTPPRAPNDAARGYHYLLTLKPINLGQPDENGVYTAKTKKEATFEVLLLIDGERGGYKKIKVELEGPVKKHETELSRFDRINLPVKKHTHTLKATLQEIDGEHIFFPLASAATVVGKDDFDAGEYSVTTNIERGAYNSTLKGLLAAANKINMVQGLVIKKEDGSEKGVGGVHVEGSGAESWVDTTAKGGFTAHTFMPKEGKQIFNVTYKTDAETIAAHTLEIVGQRLCKIELWISDPAQNDRVYLPHGNGWKSVKKRDIIKKLPEDVTDYQPVSALEFAPGTKLKAYAVLRDENNNRPQKGFLHGSHPICRLTSTSGWRKAMLYNKDWNLYYGNVEIEKGRNWVSAYLETNFGTYATPVAIITGKSTLAGKIRQAGAMAGNVLPPDMRNILDLKKRQLHILATIFAGTTSIATSLQDNKHAYGYHVDAEAKTGEKVKLTVQLFHKKDIISTDKYSASVEDSKRSLLPELKKTKEAYQYELPVEEGDHTYHVRIYYEKYYLFCVVSITGTTKKAGKEPAPEIKVELPKDYPIISDEGKDYAEATKIAVKISWRGTGKEPLLLRVSKGIVPLYSKDIGKGIEEGHVMPLLKIEEGYHDYRFELVEPRPLGERTVAEEKITLIGKTREELEQLVRTPENDEIITVETAELLPFKIELFPAESKSAITKKVEGAYETVKNNEVWVRVTLDKKALREHKDDDLTILHDKQKHTSKILGEQTIVQKIVVAPGENQIKVSLGKQTKELSIIGK